MRRPVPSKNRNLLSDPCRQVAHEGPFIVVIYNANSNDDFPTVVVTSLAKYIKSITFPES